MADDFKNYIKNYDKAGKGAKKKLTKKQKQDGLLGYLAVGFLISCFFPVLFVFWVPYLIFCLIYAAREWMG
tara:strand:+ start:863 stop:1075 length:213 start_codon:yes stop_codon:yes gene_type:complete